MRRTDAEGAVNWCQKCYSELYEQDHGEKLSTNAFKKLSALASGTSFMTIKGMANSALNKLTKDISGNHSEESVASMRAHFANGLDAHALDVYTKHINKLAEENPKAQELIKLAAIMD